MRHIRVRGASSAIEDCRGFRRLIIKMVMSAGTEKGG